MDAARAFAAARGSEARMSVTSVRNRMLDRRSLVRNVLAAGAGLALMPRLAWTQTPQPLAVDPRNPWASLPDLLARITPPRIPRRDFVITKYRTIQHAIDAAHRA